MPVHSRTDGNSPPLTPQGEPRGIVGQMLDSLDFDSQEGTLGILGGRFILARTSLLGNLLRELNPADAEVALRFYRAAERSTLDAFRTLPLLMPPGEASAPRALLLIRPLWAALGLGCLALVEAEEEEGRLVLRTHNSPWPDALGSSEVPVCHITSGTLAGLMKALGFERPSSREDHCRAQGHPNCQFTLRHRTRGEG